jgi:hypothetical protein
VNITATRHGFQQSGFSRAILSDEKGHGRVELQALCRIENGQFEGVMIPGGIFLVN